MRAFFASALSTRRRRRRAAVLVVLLLELAVACVVLRRMAVRRMLTDSLALDDSGRVGDVQMLALRNLVADPSIPEDERGQLDEWLSGEARAWFFKLDRLERGVDSVGDGLFTENDSTERCLDLGGRISASEIERARLAISELFVEIGVPAPAHSEEVGLWLETRSGVHVTRGATGGVDVTIASHRSRPTGVSKNAASRLRTEQQRELAVVASRSTAW